MIDRRNIWQYWQEANQADEGGIEKRKREGSFDCTKRDSPTLFWGWKLIAREGTEKKISSLPLSHANEEEDFYFSRGVQKLFFLGTNEKGFCLLLLLRGIKRKVERKKAIRREEKKGGKGVLKTEAPQSHFLRAPFLFSSSAQGAPKEVLSISIGRWVT